jgi:hypothetical protein
MATSIGSAPRRSRARRNGANISAAPAAASPGPECQGLRILADEGPKVEALKNNSSPSNLQKIQQIRAIHQQADPQIKAILSPGQYEKLKTVRQQAIEGAIPKRRDC